MRSTLPILALALALGALLPAGAARAGDDMIGLYADSFASTCSASLTPYQPVTIYVIATLDRLDSVSAAEFSLSDYPGSPGYPLGQCTAVWETNLIIGNLDEDFSLALNTIQSGSSVLLGTLEFLAYSDSWVDADHQMVVAAGSTRDAVLLVDGDYAEHEVLGGRFTFNCSGTCNCGPGGSENVSFSELKHHY